MKTWFFPMEANLWKFYEGLKRYQGYNISLYFMRDWNLPKVCYFLEWFKVEDVTVQLRGNQYNISTSDLKCPKVSRSSPTSKDFNHATGSLCVLFERDLNLPSGYQSTLSRTNLTKCVHRKCKTPEPPMTMSIKFKLTAYLNYTT